MRDTIEDYNIVSAFDILYLYSFIYDFVSKTILYSFLSCHPCGFLHHSLDFSFTLARPICQELSYTLICRI